MDTPLTAFAAYKGMKPSLNFKLNKKKKNKSKRKHENVAGDSKKFNGHTSHEEDNTPQQSLIKRKKKSKNKSNKKAKLQELEYGLLPIRGGSTVNGKNTQRKNTNVDVSDDETSQIDIDSEDSIVIGTNTWRNKTNVDVSDNETSQMNINADNSMNSFEIVPSGSGSLGADVLQKKSKNSRRKERKAERNKEPVEDSFKNGEDVFKWLMSPLSVDEFMRESWEKEPIYLSRNTPKYYSFLLSTPEIDEMLRNNNILFGKNLDVTSYIGGERETHNQIGRALPHVVWDYYKNKCSVRLLNPQTYCCNLQAVNTSMQEYFGCFVGANAYLTPPNSQGFAPHFDDIEAFILQIEGQKLWKIYKPRSPVEELPRFSSINLKPDELGKPVLEVTLKPGDLLYFPRGYIHQGCTVPDYHSLHLTISVYQRNSFADLIEKALPAALDSAIKAHVDFRRGLPLNTLNQFGFCRRYDTSEEKQQTIERVKSLLHRMVDHIDLDTAVDSVATSFMHSALPPVLSSDELNYTVNSGLRMTREGRVVNRVQLEPSCSVKLIRLHCCRLVREQGEDEETGGVLPMENRLYYTLENSLEYHGNEPVFLIIPDNVTDCVVTLIKSYPKYVKIEDLAQDDEEKLQLLTDLWERGLLFTKEPLTPIQEDE